MLEDQWTEFRVVGKNIENLDELGVSLRGPAEVAQDDLLLL